MDVGNVSRIGILGAGEIDGFLYKRALQDCFHVTLTIRFFATSCLSIAL